MEVVPHHREEVRGPERRQGGDLEGPAPGQGETGSGHLGFGGGVSYMATWGWIRFVEVAHGMVLGSSPRSLVAEWRCWSVMHASAGRSRSMADLCLNAECK